MIREYAWGLNLGGGKGNIIAVLDSAGSLVAQYRYSTFGQLEAKTGTLDQPFGFSTKRNDPALGLIYYGYRFYSPGQERWLKRDPLGEAGGINLYAFVGNNPVSWVDPWGLVSFTWDTVSNYCAQYPLACASLAVQGILSVNQTMQATQDRAGSKTEPAIQCKGDPSEQGCRERNPGWPSCSELERSYRYQHYAKNQAAYDLGDTIGLSYPGDFSCQSRGRKSTDALFGTIGGMHYNCTVNQKKKSGEKRHCGSLVSASCCNGFDKESTRWRAIPPESFRY